MVSRSRREAGLLRLPRLAGETRRCGSDSAEVASWQEPSPLGGYAASRLPRGAAACGGGEDRLSIRLEQCVPHGLIDTRRRRGGVVGGEGDHDAIEPGSGELDRPDLTVPAIAPQRRGHRQARRVKHRGNRASDRAEAGMALADVVEQRGNEHVIAIWEHGRHPLGNLEGVALVGGILSPEQVRPGPAEMVMNELLLERSEARFGDVSEEPANQMSGVFPAVQRYELFLQSTQ